MRKPTLTDNIGTSKVSKRVYKTPTLMQQVLHSKLMQISIPLTPKIQSDYFLDLDEWLGEDNLW